MRDSVKAELRREGRARRRRYQGADRVRSESSICAHILHAPQLREVIKSGKLIGAYLAFDGEVSLATLWGGEAHPVWSRDDLTHRDSSSSEDEEITSRLRDLLVFPRHKPGQALSFVRPDRWVGSGPLPLPEGPIVSLESVGALLIPGVWFEPHRGGRIGLGGGHYDRTLALRAETSWSALCFGVGFTFQMRPDLPLDPWDVFLDGIFTERGLIE